MQYLQSLGLRDTVPKVKFGATNLPDKQISFYNKLVNVFFFFFFYICEQGSEE